MIGTGVGLAFCRSRAGKINSLIGGAVFIFAVTGMVSRSALIYEFTAASILLAGAAFIRFIRSSVAARAGKWLLQPRVSGAAVMAIGTGLITLCAFQFSADNYEEDERALAVLEQATTWRPPLEAAPVVCQTDAGTPVTVFSATVQRPQFDLVESERDVLAGFEWEHRVIHRSPADDVSNCHGWVFTGGKYWVLGSDVMTILEQNGYRPVRNPRPGDLVIYRNSDGAVSHTGIVRSVGAVTMVESKWGWMGVYLHDVNSSCYGRNYRFYHNSGRTGHQFAQLNPSDAAPVVRPARMIWPTRRPEPNR